MEQVAQLTTIRYIRHAEDLHEVVILEASRKGVEDLFTCVYQVYRFSQPEARLKFLVNNGLTGSLPIQSLLPQLRSFAQHPFRPAAVAVIIPKTAVNRVVMAMIDVLPINRQNQIRYYTIEEYDQALQWVQDYNTST